MADLLPSAAGEVSQKWTLLDGDRELAVSNTWEHLEEALFNFPKRAFTPNTIVDFISPQGDILSFGIAGNGDDDNPGLAEPLACVNYVDRTQNPPYLTVVDNSALSF